MLQLRLSLSRQSNPSTLTAGLLPKLARTHPPFLAEDGGEGGRPDGAGTTTHDDGERGEKFSSPNRASWISGLATLLGGDPQKNGGGDEATGGLNNCSVSKSSSCKSTKAQNRTIQSKAITQKQKNSTKSTVIQAYFNK